VVVTDDDHVASACVAGKARRESETLSASTSRGDIDDYVQVVVRAVSDPCDDRCPEFGDAL